MDDEELGPDGQDADDGPNNGRLTTIIPRPTNRRASDAGGSRLGRRRRGAKANRISSRRYGWLFGVAAVVVAGAIAAALFVLPVRTWFDQDDQIDALDNELDEMRAVNDDLTDEVNRLLTDEGIIEAAREELGQIQAEEHRQTMLAPPDLPRDMPRGWPYTQVDQILTANATAAVAAAAGGEPGAGGPAADDGAPDADDGANSDGGGAGGFQPITAATSAGSGSTTTTTVATAAPTTSSAASTAAPGPSTTLAAAAG